VKVQVGFWCFWMSITVFNTYYGFCHFSYLSVRLFNMDYTHFCCLFFDSACWMLQVPGSNSWLYNLISTIIGNLKVTISNVHIRYEDSVRYAKSFAHFFSLSFIPMSSVNLFFVFLPAILGIHLHLASRCQDLQPLQSTKTVTRHLMLV
jgi:hypothetical protein